MSPRCSIIPYPTNLKSLRRLTKSSMNFFLAYICAYAPQAERHNELAVRINNRLSGSHIKKKPSSFQFFRNILFLRITEEPQNSSHWMHAGQFPRVLILILAHRPSERAAPVVWQVARTLLPSTREAMSLENVSACSTYS